MRENRGSLKDFQVSAGRLFVSEWSSNGVNALVCIGKSIVRGTYFNRHIFAVLTLHETVRTTEELVEYIKRGRFQKDVKFQLLKDDVVIDCGKLVEPEQINIWLTQLKLAGFLTYAESGEAFYASLDMQIIKGYGYIGDWENRKKLPCVKKSDLKVGCWYINEPLAYVRQSIKHLNHSTDTLWYFAGVTKNLSGMPMYVWYEVKTRGLEYALEIMRDTGQYLEKQVGETQYMQRHAVVRQYSDMVLFDKAEYNLPKQVSPQAFRTYETSYELKGDLEFGYLC